MTKSERVRVRRGTRAAWIAENQGRFICACGCGQPIPLRPEHFNVGVPSYVHGHNPGPHKKPPLPRSRCECGCGQLASPGKRFISGHNGRGIPRTDETRAKLSKAQRGERNYNFGKLGPRATTWKGGRTRTPAGYIQIASPGHPNATSGNYVMEHRLVVEAHLITTDPGSAFLTDSNGVRVLRRDVEVHHINGVKDDNRLENLEAMTKAEHTRHHMLGNTYAAKKPQDGAASRAM